MQYCVSGSASNLITLISPDLQVLGTILLSSHYACIVAARPILALCMHWRCAPQPMRILSSWLVKEYCNAALRIRICIKLKWNDTHQSAISGEHPSKRPASKGLVTTQAEGRDEKAGIGRSGIKKARDTKRSAANGPVEKVLMQVISDICRQISWRDMAKKCPGYEEFNLIVHINVFRINETNFWGQIQSSDIKL